MNGLRELNTFFVSVQYHNQALADQIAPDVELVALYGLSADKEGGRESAERLVLIADRYLPAVHSRVLRNALEDLGF
jgi:hypothetical protein